MATFHVGEICEDVDDQYYFVNTLFTEITNKHIPLKTRNIKPKQPPFMNAVLHKCTMNKARLQQQQKQIAKQYKLGKFQATKKSCYYRKIKRKSIRTYFHER